MYKHAATALHTFLDYFHLSFQEIPPDITGIQVAQKWHVPSSTTFTLVKIVKFIDITFEKEEIGKKRKRPIVNWEC